MTYLFGLSIVVGRTLTSISELHYTGSSYRWGFQIGDEEQRYQWFKLDLDPWQTRGTSDLARRYAAHNALPPGYDVNTEKLVTDFLTALRKHAEAFLKHKLPEGALKSTHIEHIITYGVLFYECSLVLTAI